MCQAYIENEEEKLKPNKKFMFVFTLQPGNAASDAPASRFIQNQESMPVSPS